MLDHHECIIDCNETLIQTLHIDRDKLIGTALDSLIEQEDLAIIRDKRRRQDTTPTEVKLRLNSSETLPTLLHIAEAHLDDNPVTILSLLDISGTKVKQLEIQQAYSELDTIYNNSIVGIILLDGHRIIRRANPHFATIFGYDSIHDVEGQSIRIIHRSEQSFLEFAEFYRTTLLAKGVADTQTQFVRKDGQVIWVQVSGKAVDHASPPDLNKGVIWILRNITERMEAQIKLEEANAELKSYFNNSMVGIILVGEHGRINRVNHRMVDILGYTAASELEGHSLQDLHPEGSNYHKFEEFARKKLPYESISNIEVRLKKRDGTVVWLGISGQAIDSEYPANLDKGVVWIFEDITDRKAAEAKLVELACMDELTGVCNRRNFMDLAERELAQHTRKKRSLVVAMLDLDHFKRINDEKGHKVGDEALQLFTQVCQQSLRTSDIIGRLGGEEFALLLPDTELDQACQVAERIREALIAATPNGNIPAMTVSIGLTPFDGQASLENLLQQADNNLYKAKARGRNQVAYDN